MGADCERGGDAGLPDRKRLKGNKTGAGGMASLTAHQPRAGRRTVKKKMVIYRKKNKKTRRLMQGPVSGEEKQVPGTHPTLGQVRLIYILSRGLRTAKPGRLSTWV